MTAAKPDHEFVPHPKGPDHYTGCTQYVEGQSYCGLPRSAHATPPRSELADQLEVSGIFGTQYDALMAAIRELRQEGGGNLYLHQPECAIYASGVLDEGQCVCDGGPALITVPGDS